MNYITLTLTGLLLACGLSITAQEKFWTSGRPDGHAPISIMGDHTHKQGEIMFSYRYMPMWMKGNLSGSDEIANDRIYEDFMIAPQNMSMDMHMLGLMYAATDRITLMAMGNYLSNSMDLRAKNGGEFNTSSGGIGDASISVLVQVMNVKRNAIHINAGVSLPLGDIDQRDDIPVAENAPLAYPMQLGSGTYDPMIGLTYLGQSDYFSWGIQPHYKFRLGENDETYTLGNQLNLSGWIAAKISDYLSFSVSAQYMDLQSIEGADPDFNPMMMPLFNTSNSGREQFDLGLGINYYIPTGSFRNLRFGAEVLFPVYQNVSGIQMKNTLMATFGVQYSF